MSEIPSDGLEAFVEHVVGLLTKNGFPERKVAFPIERMYDSAHAKGVNFNKVLDALAARGITHEKTPEKVIFSNVAPALTMPDMGPFSGLDPAAFEGMLARAALRRRGRRDASDAPRTARRHARDGRGHDARAAGRHARTGA
jgi:hypothetical protein